MFSQEGDELLAGPVHGEVLGLHLLSAQHRLKKLLATARPLPLLRHVKVQHAHRTHLVGLTGLVKEEQLLPADLEHPDDGALAAARGPVHQHVDGLTLGRHHLRPAGDRVLEVLGRSARLPHYVKHGANLKTGGVKDRFDCLLVIVSISNLISMRSMFVNAYLRLNCNFWPSANVLILG